MCGQQWCVTGISVLVTEKSTEFAPSVLFSVFRGGALNSPGTGEDVSVVTYLLFL